MGLQCCRHKFYMLRLKCPGFICFGFTKVFLRYFGLGINGRYLTFDPAKHIYLGRLFDLCVVEGPFRAKMWM